MNQQLRQENVELPGGTVAVESTVARGARILVCDDDRNVRAVARLRLCASGYDVLDRKSVV